MVERRLTWLAGIILLWGGAILFKIVSIQVVHHQEYVRLARARQELLIDLPAPRGTIFDRTGAPLAMSVPTSSIYINPVKIPDIGVASDILAMVLHLDRTELYGKIKLAADGRRGFLWIKRKISPEEQQSVRNLRLSWIGLESETQRRYPGGSLAAHVLGGVDFQEKGNSGVEKALDDVLRGAPGQARLLTDVKRRGIDQQLDSEARAGTPITLTIDERLQFVAERELAAAVQARQATSGSLVVMNPNDGQIYALASYPTYDPNSPPEPGSNPIARMNHATSVPFEPGSVFKVITLSAALETTALRPETPINCHGGVLRLPGRVIHDSHAGLGIIPMAMVLAKSSNIGAIEVGTRVGQDNMYDYVRRFGFGQKTGIELPAESGGRVRKTAYWGKTSLASISMGQEVSVTTVQLAQAAAAVANGGLRVRPRLVLKQGDRLLSSQPPTRVLKPESTITMRQMMEGVVMPGGTGTRARLEGYSVGGKTGSAQIFDVATHRYTHSYNGSFVGLAPVTNPAIVVVVTLNGTHGNAGFGGAAAAPVFHVVATEALRILDVPRDVPDEETPAPTRIAQTKDDTNDLAIAELGSGQPNILEEGDEDGAATVVQGPKVPKFLGMSMRAALAEAARQGLALVPDGSGIATGQMPPPGAALRAGERIRVRFSR